MSDFWSPQSINAYHSRQAEQQAQAQQAQQAEQAAQQQDYLRVVGNALVGIISRYTDNDTRADTDQVEREFRAMFPQAGPGDFRQSVDALKREHVLYEVMSDRPGFMGQQRTHLYAL